MASVPSQLLREPFNGRDSERVTFDVEFEYAGLVATSIQRLYNHLTRQAHSGKFSSLSVTVIRLRLLLKSNRLTCAKSSKRLRLFSVTLQSALQTANSSMRPYRSLTRPPERSHSSKPMY